MELANHRLRALLRMPGKTMPGLVAELLEARRMLAEWLRHLDGQNPRHTGLAQHTVSFLGEDWD